MFNTIVLVVDNSKLLPDRSVTSFHLILLFYYKNLCSFKPLVNSFYIDFINIVLSLMFEGL